MSQRNTNNRRILDFGGNPLLNQTPPRHVASYAAEVRLLRRASPNELADAASPNSVVVQLPITAPAPDDRATIPGLRRRRNAFGSGDLRAAFLDLQRQRPAPPPRTWSEEQQHLVDEQIAREEAAALALSDVRAQTSPHDPPAQGDSSAAPAPRRRSDVIVRGRGSGTGRRGNGSGGRASHSRRQQAEQRPLTHSMVWQQVNDTQVWEDFGNAMIREGEDYLSRARPWPAIDHALWRAEPYLVRRSHVASPYRPLNGPTEDVSDEEGETDGSDLGVQIAQSLTFEARLALQTEGPMGAALAEEVRRAGRRARAAVEGYEEWRARRRRGG